MDTHSPLKKSQSKPRNQSALTPSQPQYTATEIEAMLRAGRWWPFDRVDGALLQRLHKQAPPVNHLDDVEEAPW